MAPEEIERLVREALRARRAEKFTKIREKLAAVPLPPMTAEEIQAEIDAYRADMRRAAGYSIPTPQSRRFSGMARLAS